VGLTLGRNDPYSVVGGIPGARVIEGKVSRISGTDVFIVSDQFDAGLEFGPVMYDGPAPPVGARAVVDIMTGTTECWIVSWDGQGVAASAPAAQQVGDIFMTGGVARAGCLACNGGSYLRTDYPELFTALGGASSPWGLPDGTHFKVPDLRGRSPMGAGTGAGLTARSLAALLGEENHLLSGTESGIAAHTHGFQVHMAYTAGGNVTAQGNANTADWGGISGPVEPQVNTNAVSAHNNIQPSAVVNFWIAYVSASNPTGLVGPQGPIGPTGGNGSVPLDTEHFIGAAGEPAFQNGWVNYTGLQNMKFRKDPFGKVQIEGDVRNGTNGSVICNLPAGYRPPNDSYAPCVGSGGAAGNFVAVFTNGNIVGSMAASTELHFKFAFDTDTVTTCLVGPQGPPGPAGPAGSTAATLDIEHVVGAVGEPPFQNGWSGGPVKFRKDPFGRVLLSGSATGGTNTTPIFTLPLGYRPPVGMFFPVLGVSGVAGNYVLIGTDGTVSGTRTGADLYLGGIVLDTDTVTSVLVGPQGPMGPAGQGTPWYGTAPPGSPVDGQEWVCPVGSVGVVWRFRYNAASASPYKWEFIGGSQFDNYVDAAQSTSSTTPVTLGGPTLTLPRNGDYSFQWDTRVYGTVAGQSSQCWLCQNGTQLTLLDHYTGSGGTGSPSIAVHQSRTWPRAAVVAGDVFDLRYQVNGGTGTFQYRHLGATPVRVS
jgi:microcystin-dependent protein